MAASAAVATTSGQGERDTINNLRNRYPDRFDRGLVSLAVTGADSTETPSEVNQYYRAQCELFGLDEKTFQPNVPAKGEWREARLAQQPHYLANFPQPTCDI
jgi:hypothetical protein